MERTERKCPRCGAALILRIAKKGEHAGKQFYGCSAFPKCRYIMQPAPASDGDYRCTLYREDFGTDRPEYNDS